MCSQGICECTLHCDSVITQAVIASRRKQLADMAKLKKRVIYFELSGFYNGNKFETRYGHMHVELQFVL
jgi:hypothetical protein